MSVSINPGTFNNRRLFDSTGKADQAEFSKLFNDLSQWAQQIQANLSAPLYLAGLLNGNNAIFLSALGVKVTDLGTITTDQTVPVNGAPLVYVRLNSAVTQTRTITLSNLPQGSAVMLVVGVSANTLTLKLAATDTGGHTYTITAFNTSNGVPVNMVSTGQASTSTAPYFGLTGFIGTSVTPDLTLLQA